MPVVIVVSLIVSSVIEINSLNQEDPGILLPVLKQNPIPKIGLIK
jgi:hypothetical protein